jgi:serine/threonine protein kinase/outer membrane protein OmpA-like peptidoglycan-associated protein
VAYVEVKKGGKVITRRLVDDSVARKGCRIRVGSAAKTRLEIGQSKTVGSYLLTMFEGQPPQDTRFELEELTQVVGTFPPISETEGTGLTEDNVVRELTRPEKAIYPVIGGYRIIGKLGRGGMGTVWQAVQLSTRRRVALKLMAKGSWRSKRLRHRFEREVKLATGLVHPNIARVYASGSYHGVYYYAMELVDGCHIDQYVSKHNLSHREILELMRTVCQAVYHAHRHGIIHRDLKPSNILVSELGQPRVLDFGLAKSFLQDDTAVTISIEGEVAGTPAYMSPEQAMGQVDKLDPRTDVYSLGVILFRFLTGQHPHDTSGTRYEIIRRIAEESVRRPREINKDINPKLEMILLKALAFDPDDRYLSAGELADDIDNYLHGKPLAAELSPAGYPGGNRLNWFDKLEVAAAIAAALSLLAIAVITGLRQKQPQPASHAGPAPEQQFTEGAVKKSAPSVVKPGKTADYPVNDKQAAREFSEAGSILVSNFDGLNPFVPEPFPDTRWRALKGNESATSTYQLDSDSNPVSLPCCLKWHYEIEGTWANIDLLLSGSWKKPVDLSQYDSLSFYIKAPRGRGCKLKIQAAPREGPERHIGKEIPIHASSEWRKVDIPLKTHPALSNIDLSRTYTLEFVDFDRSSISNTIWLDDIVLHRPNMELKQERDQRFSPEETERRRQTPLAEGKSPHLYETDFNVSGFDKWQVLSGNWTISDGILSSGGQRSEWVSLKEYVWQDCKITYRYRIISGDDAWVHFRADLTGQQGWSFSCFQQDSGTLKIRHNPSDRRWRNISKQVPAPRDKEWHIVECIIQGPNVDCYVDGELKVSTQQCPVNAGTIGFRTLNTKMEVDSIQVEKLEEKEQAKKGALIEAMQRELLDTTQPLRQLSSVLEEWGKRGDSAVYDANKGIIRFEGDLLFAPGSDEVLPTAAELLKELCRILNTEQAREFDIIVAGHTDDLPIRRPAVLAKHPTNWHLSAHRAISVRDIMTNNGIASERVKIQAFGESMPLVPNGPNQGGNPRNRRVEIYIVPKGANASP